MQLKQWLSDADVSSQHDLHGDAGGLGLGRTGQLSWAILRLLIWTILPARAAVRGRMCKALGGSRMPPCAWQIRWNFVQA